MADRKCSGSKNPPGKKGPSAGKNVARKSSGKTENVASGTAYSSNAVSKSRSGKEGPSAEKNVARKSSGKTENVASGTACSSSGISTPQPQLSKTNESKPNHPKGKPKKGGGKPKALYDKNGIHIETGLDLCDCLKKECTGCFFPCGRCGSEKCGPHCRRNRKFAYEEIVDSFNGLTVTNPFL